MDNSKKVKVASISKSDFLGTAKPLTLQVLDGDGKMVGILTMAPKEFSTGSYGYGLGGQKLTLNIGGKSVQCQISFNLPVVNSKPAQE